MQPLLHRLSRPALLVAIGAVFGWLGPYGTYELALSERLLYWMLVIPLIGLIARPVFQGVAQRPPADRWPAPAQALAAAVLVGIPGTLVVIAIRTIFQRAIPITAPSVLSSYLAVTVMIGLIGTPLWTLRGRSPRPAGTSPLAPEPAAATVAGPAPFLRRLPPRLGTDLLAIATEDHYLRVTTALGSDLILLRLSDALAELDPAFGKQVHRSHWVARRAVAAVERDGHRTILRLVNGAEIPVSRTYLPALRAAGWLAADGGSQVQPT